MVEYNRNNIVPQGVVSKLFLINLAMGDWFRKNYDH